MNTTRKMAASATLHCLIGCVVGELIGVTIGTHSGIGRENTIVLAFVMSFSVVPMMRAGMKFISALKLVFAADTISILTMTIVDNITMLTIPGAFDKDLSHPVYWLSRAIAVALAFLAAWPVNYYLLTKNKGHALHHEHHGHQHEHME